MEALDSGLTGEMWSRLINLGSELLDKCLRLSRSWRYAHRRDLIAKSRRNVLAKFPDECNTDTVIDSLLSFLENSFPQENSELRPVLPAYDLERIQFETIFKWFTQYVNEIEKTLAQSENDGREAYAVVVAAVVLLSYVYLYLTGSGGWDGSRAVSSGSLDYRDTYIAIVLFRGAYVWIKFRDVAPTKRIPAGAVQQIKTSCKDGRIKEKYEPRFKPRKENGVSFNWIYLGRFDSPADAEVVYRMAASCYDYGKGYGTPLDLAGDGREFFTIIPEFTPAERTLSGRAKQELVKERVQELYKRYKTKKATLNIPPTLPGANLEQELQNRRLQSEILSEQQQKEDLARQLQQCQNLQQAQMIQIQNLQRQVQDQQAQQNLQQPQQFQVPNLQPQPQLPHLQQQQREEEPFTIDEIWNVFLGRDTFPEEAGFGAESASFFGDIQLMDATTT